MVRKLYHPPPLSIEPLPFSESGSILGEGPMKIVEAHLSEDQNKDATSEEIR